MEILPEHLGECEECARCLCSVWHSPALSVVLWHLPAPPAVGHPPAVAPSWPRAGDVGGRRVKEALSRG